MQLVDVLAVVLMLVGVSAFALGGWELSRAADLDALYWLAVGIVGVRGAVHIARPREGNA